MSNSLLAGVSGLRAHQAMLDVVGNNLANMNTTGFKAERANFSELISDTLRAATAPTASVGGTNPVQVGLGVRVASIDRDLRQGSFQSTERGMDVGIAGEGYFVVNDGRQNLYTRAGSFSLDSDHRLVMSGSGQRVQSTNGTDITIDSDAQLPAAATGTINLAGNLDAAAAAPQATVLSSLQPYLQGTPSTLTGAAGPYALADGMTMEVAVDGGPPRTVTFQAASFGAIGAATAAEVAAVLNAQVPGINASDVGGAVQLASLRVGSASSLDVNEGTGSPAAVLGLSTTLSFGTQVPASAATPLNALPQTIPAHVPGDRFDITGTDADGTPVGGTFVFGSGPGQNGTTVGDLMSFLTGLFPASSVNLGADGKLAITADANGASPLQVTMIDDPANTGFTTWSSLAAVPTTTGNDGATVTTAIDVYDTQGNAHTVRLTFHKTGASEWEINAELPDDDGVVLDGTVTGVRFREDGGFDFVSGTGLGDARLSFQFTGLNAAQDVQLALGSPGSFNGLTQFGGGATVAAIGQDGHASGSLASLAIGADGAIQGVYTNGQVQTLATLQIATFANPAGLLKVGDSLLSVSTNSGEPLLGQPGSGRAGSLTAGVLESSNVDVALEFTRLITAQRGFQVNARTITTTDQMLQELANLVR